MKISIKQTLAVILFAALAQSAVAQSRNTVAIAGSMSFGAAQLFPDEKLNMEPYMFLWNREDDRAWMGEFEVRFSRDNLYGADLRLRVEEVLSAARLTNPTTNANTPPETSGGTSIFAPWQNPAKLQAWVRLFNDQLRVFGGRIADQTFRTPGWRDMDLDEEWGFFFLGKPALDGMKLNLGLGAYWNPAQSYPADYKMKITDTKLMLSALYELPDIFRVIAVARTPSTIKGVTQVTPAAGGKPAEYEAVKSTWISPSDNSALFLFSASLLALPGVSAHVEGVIRNLDYFADHARAEFAQTIGYNFDPLFEIPLQVQLNLGQYLLGDVVNRPGEYSPGLRFWLWAAWNGLLEGKLIPRLDVNYFLAGNWGYGHYHSHLNRLYGSANFNSLDAVYDKDLMNYAHSYTANYDRNWSTFGIQPSVTFRFGPASYLELGYVMNVDLNNSKNPRFDISAASRLWNGTRMSHVIYTGIMVQWW
jgi:hypothetical protein